MRHEVAHLRDKFDQTTADEVWMTELGKEGDWVVITSDYRITKNKHEKAAWEESNLTVFFLRRSWLDIGFWEQASQLVKLWPDIVSIAERNPTSMGYNVPVKGAKFESI